MDLRLLFVAPFTGDPDSGAAGVVHALAKAMRDRDHRVDVRYLGELSPIQNRFAVDIAPFSVLASTARRLESYDVVEASAFSGWLLFPAFRHSRRRPLFVARSLGLQLDDHRALMADVALGRASVSRRYRLRGGLLQLKAEETAIRMADGLACNTRTTAERVVAHGWKRREEICVAGCGITPEALLAARRADRPWAGRVIWCGTIVERKGWWDFVDGYARAARTMPLSLELIGTGLPRERVLQDFPAESWPRLHVHPRLPRLEQINLMASGDCFVSASLSEGFHLALLEAMAVGLPCIATQEGFLLDEADPGRLACIVPKRNPAEIAAAIENLAADAQRRRELSENGKSFARNRSWADVAAAYEAWLDEALRSHRARET